jgi:hypothetical protein
MVDIATHSEPPRKPKPNGKAPAPKKGKGEDFGPVLAPANPREARRARAWLKDRIARAKLLKPNTLIVEQVDMNPVFAEVMLEECNFGNRKTRQARIDLYDTIMVDGRWILHSQGISISREGLLNNGQHRLKAIVQSGCTVPMMVAFGEDRDAINVIDSGGIRTASDILMIDGHKYTTALGAGARTIMMIDSGVSFGSNVHKQYTNDLILEFVNDHPALTGIVADACKLSGALKCSAAAMVAAVYLIDRDSKHRHKLHEFMTKLQAGTELKAKDPILSLRDGLIRKSLDSGRNGRMNALSIAAAIINAWNRWLAGKPISTGRLAWKSNTQFPVAE